MYDDALRLFHIEIRPANKGHLIFVTDGNGNPVRHPIKMSDFEKRPWFYQSQLESEKSKLFNTKPSMRANSMLERMENYKFINNLLRIIPNYKDDESVRNKQSIMKRTRLRRKR